MFNLNLPRAKIKRKIRTEEEKLKMMMEISRLPLAKKWKLYLDISAEEDVESINQLEIIEKLADAIPKEVKTALAIGVGDGTEMEGLETRGIKTIGIQINPYQIKKLKKKGLECFLMDMHEMRKFKDEQFDIVFCKDTFKQAMSPIIAFLEMIRVTKKYLLISEPDRKWGFKAHNYQLLDKWQWETLGLKYGMKIEKFWEIKMSYVNQQCYLFKKLW